MYQTLDGRSIELTTAGELSLRRSMGGRGRLINNEAEYLMKNYGDRGGFNSARLGLLSPTNII